MSKKRVSLKDSLASSTTARAEVAAATANALAASLRPAPPVAAAEGSTAPLGAFLSPAPAPRPATDATLGVRLDAPTLDLLHAVALHRAAASGRKGAVSVAAVVRRLIHEHADELRAEVGL